MSRASAEKLITKCVKTRDGHDEARSDLKFYATYDIN